MIQGIRKAISKYPALFVVLLGFIAHLLFVIVFSMPVPGENFGVYDSVAQYFANGEGFGLLKHIQPGWPSVLGTLYATVGRSAVAIYGLQIIFGTLLVWGVFRLARYAFGDSQLALAAGIVSALWPFFLLTAVDYGGTNNLFFTTLLVFAAYYLLKGIQEEKVPEAIFAGVLLAFATLTDVVVLYLLPVLLVLLVVHLKWIQHISLKRLIVPTALLLAFVSVIGIWTYRNHVVFEADFVNQALNERHPEVVRISAGSSEAPIVAKEKELHATKKWFWKRFLRTNTKEAATEVKNMFTFPYQLSYLTQDGVTVSYKKQLIGLLKGKPLPDSLELDVLAGKVLLTLLHWILLLFGVWGIWSVRRRSIGILTAGLLVYITVAVIGVKITSFGPSVVSSTAYFVFPITPFLLIIGIYKARELSGFNVSQDGRAEE